MVGLMNAGVTDIAQARAKRANSVVSLKREPLTIICQAANIRADGEVHRQIGFSDALTFTELHRVLRICFGHQGTKTKERQGIGSNQTAFGCDPIRIRGRDTHGSGLGNAARQGVIEGVVVLALILRLVVVGHSDHFKRR